MLLERIEHWAKNCPQRAAHRSREQVLTYRDLKNYSDALAVRLEQIRRENGIQRGTPCIVYGHKQNAMLVAFLACVKAGCPYVPVDVSVPAERLRQIIVSSGARIIITAQPLPVEVLRAETAEGVEKFMIELPQNGWEADTAIWPETLGKRPDPAWQVQLEEVYYIIYTSGSTGVPKGVQITLAALESFLNWGKAVFQPVEAQETFLNQAPFSFDLSVMDLYLSLANGGTLWSVDHEQMVAMQDLFASLAASGITYWVSTPSFAEICLTDKSFRQTLLPKLKTFLFCGEVLTNECAAKLLDRFPQARVENTYGPTEATVAVTSLDVTEEVLQTYSPLPVGRVKPDGRILICNPEELTAQLEAHSCRLPWIPQELPEGERGEIIIAGPNVSAGYLNQPELTRRAFFSWTEEGVSWRAYRTGDAGIKQGELIFFCGRLDFQVKLHGYRIELGDIEENLRRIPWVKNAVVLPVGQPGKIEYLKAFLSSTVPVENEFEAGQKIRTELRRCLPEYMIPRRFAFVEAMPLTGNGKVDRRALLRGNSR